MPWFLQYRSDNPITVYLFWSDGTIEISAEMLWLLNGGGMMGLAWEQCGVAPTALFTQRNFRMNIPKA
jgi:hypothetical protein